MRNWLLLSLAAFFCAACAQNETATKSNDPAPLLEGPWRGAVVLNDSVEVAFGLQLQKQSDSTYHFWVLNAGDTVRAELLQQGDSLRVDFPVFANYLTLHRKGDSLRGFFINPDAEDYRLAFYATPGAAPRYRPSTPPSGQLAGEWAARLYRADGSSRPAILNLTPQKEARLYGSVRSETGDYRFLEGTARDAGFVLSTFDGGFIAYFAAKLVGDTLRGQFYSGKFSAPWQAWRDSSFALRDPAQLTYLKDGYDKIDFALPDLQGDTLRLSDSQFAGKAVVIQIMGSWCPNCLDESRYLNEVYDSYHSEGLAMVGLSFERARDRATALRRAQKMQRDLKIPYPILLATATAREPVQEVLPMLNRIMSFPTTIWLDRQHRVQKIHTGFAGPGTPVYDDYIKENDRFIRDLLR